MRTFGIFAITALLAFTGSTMAQERTATQGADAQMNWNNLRGQLDLISNQNKAIAAAVDAMSGKLNAIAACGNAKKIWNGTTCVDVAVVNTTTTVNTGTHSCGSLVLTQKVSNGAISTKSQTACNGVTLVGNASGITNCPTGGTSSGGASGDNSTTQTVCGYQGCGSQGCYGYSCSQMAGNRATERYYTFTCNMPNE